MSFLPNIFQVFLEERSCMILQSWNLYKQNTVICYFLDDTYITHTSKDKWKLKTITKNHPIAHVTFLFSFEIQYLLVNFIFEEKLFSFFTRDCNNCWWLVKIREKKQCGQIWFFLTAIWQPHGQLWAIIKGTAPLAWC